MRIPRFPIKDFSLAQVWLSVLFILVFHLTTSDNFYTRCKMLIFCEITATGGQCSSNNFSHEHTMHPRQQSFNTLRVFVGFIYAIFLNIELFAIFNTNINNIDNHTSANEKTLIGKRVVRMKKVIRPTLTPSIRVYMNYQQFCWSTENALHCRSIKKHQ